jgi:hypothetical protein
MRTCPPLKRVSRLCCVLFLSLTNESAFRYAFSMPYQWALSIYAWIQSGRFVFLFFRTVLCHAHTSLKRDYDARIREYGLQIYDDISHTTLTVDGNLSFNYKSACSCTIADPSDFNSVQSDQNANPNTVGYVTSGFWAGQAISRFIWGYYTPRYDTFFTYIAYCLDIRDLPLA